MPQSFMDWIVVIGVVAAILGVVVAFMRRPTKTTNKITGGSRNNQTGGAGTTSNNIENGNDNNQSG